MISCKKNIGIYIPIPLADLQLVLKIKECFGLVFLISIFIVT